MSAKRVSLLAAVLLAASGVILIYVLHRNQPEPVSIAAEELHPSGPIEKSEAVAGDRQSESSARKPAVAVVAPGQTDDDPGQQGLTTGLPLPPSVPPAEEAISRTEQGPVESANSDIGAQHAISPKEMMATAQMYAAHASLRASEVADPDSESNRRILQSMIIKALARAEFEKENGSVDSGK